MTITVKEFVESSSGVDEFEVHGKPNPKYKAIMGEYDFFFRSDLEVSHSYSKFKDRQIKSFKFCQQSEGWITCELYLAD